MEFLLEINVEEMPPAHIRSALEDMLAKLKKDLAAALVIPNFRAGAHRSRAVLVQKDGDASGNEAKIYLLDKKYYF